MSGTSVLTKGDQINIMVKTVIKRMKALLNSENPLKASNYLRQFKLGLNDNGIIHTRPGDIQDSRTIYKNVLDKLSLNERKIIMEHLVEKIPPLDHINEALLYREDFYLEDVLYLKLYNEERYKNEIDALSTQSCNGNKKCSMLHAKIMDALIKLENVTEKPKSEKDDFLKKVANSVTEEFKSKFGDDLNDSEFAKMFANSIKPEITKIDQTVQSDLDKIISDTIDWISSVSDENKIIIGGMHKTYPFFFILTGIFKIPNFDIDTEMEEELKDEFGEIEYSPLVSKIITEIKNAGIGTNVIHWNVIVINTAFDDSKENKCEGLEFLNTKDFYLNYLEVDEILKTPMDIFINYAFSNGCPIFPDFKHVMSLNDGSKKEGGGPTILGPSVATAYPIGVSAPYPNIAFLHAQPSAPIPDGFNLLASFEEPTGVYDRVKQLFYPTQYLEEAVSFAPPRMVAQDVIDIPEYVLETLSLTGDVYRSKIDSMYKKIEKNSTSTPNSILLD